MAKRFGESQTRPPYTYIFSESTAVRVYADSKPHNLKTAPLQKGLILLFRRREIVGEGVGFGVPVIKYKDQTYYSADSMLQTSRNSNQEVIIRKEYRLNAVRRSKIDSTQNPAIQNRIEDLNRIYQNNKQIAAFMLKLKPFLYPFVVNSKFVSAPPRGRVVATYKIKPNHINIDLDFSGVEPKNLQQIVVLNEQGAHFFRNYTDSDGLSLCDGGIGIWTLVYADYATISSHQNGLSFTLKKAQDAVLRRGREVAAGYLDWAGLDYELPPNTSEFSYDITLSGANT